MSTIDHPQHYQHPSGVEAIDICEHLGFNGFNLGNAYKYLARAGKKGPAAEDLRKAAWYLRRAISDMTNRGAQAFNTRIETRQMARMVLVAGADFRAHRMMLLAITDGSFNHDDCKAIADECEREAAAAESGQ